jgi:hypothetical protein
VNEIIDRLFATAPEERGRIEAIEGAVSMVKSLFPEY